MTASLVDVLLSVFDLRSFVLLAPLGVSSAVEEGHTHATEVGRFLKQSDKPFGLFLGLARATTPMSSPFGLGGSTSTSPPPLGLSNIQKQTSKRNCALKLLSGAERFVPEKSPD